MMRKLRQRSRSKGAFTLLEVLMVVSIIGLLAVVLVTALSGTQRKAKEDVTKLLIDKVSMAIERYALHMGHYPTEDDGGLQALIDPPDDEDDEKKWGGPYLDVKNLKDAWDSDLVYTFPGDVNEDKFDLVSPGPDLDEGTDDDIANYERD